MKTQIFGFGAAHDPIWDLDSGFWILVSAIRIQNPDPRIQNPTILVFWILDSELPAFRRGTRPWRRFGIWILDSGFWILDSAILSFRRDTRGRGGAGLRSGFWILDSGFWILDSGF